jgi:hypothetical protein
MNRSKLYFYFGILLAGILIICYLPGIGSKISDWHERWTGRSYIRDEDKYQRRPDKCVFRPFPPPVSVDYPPPYRS